MPRGKQFSSSLTFSVSILSMLRYEHHLLH
ncbi:hypothetical protein ID866_10487 [Astraeus odoratus]|nr:hypothetical protein ID866_10487 [Astraeus odoratus]